MTAASNPAVELTEAEVKWLRNACHPHEDLARVVVATVERILAARLAAGGVTADEGLRHPYCYVCDEDHPAAPAPIVGRADDTAAVVGRADDTAAVWEQADQSCRRPREAALKRDPEDMAAACLATWSTPSELKIRHDRDDHTACPRTWCYHAALAGAPSAPAEDQGGEGK